MLLKININLITKDQLHTLLLKINVFFCFEESFSMISMKDSSLREGATLTKPSLILDYKVIRALFIVAQSWKSFSPRNNNKFVSGITMSRDQTVAELQCPGTKQLRSYNAQEPNSCGVTVSRIQTAVELQCPETKQLRSYNVQDPNSCGITMSRDQTVAELQCPGTKQMWNYNVQGPNSCKLPNSWREY